MSVAANIKKLKSELPSNVQLIAVSKTKPVALIEKAYEIGQRAFGENKVQELVSKQEVLPKDIEWHFIGHLQSNKVKYMASFVHLIHSIDSLKLLEVVDKEGAKHQRIIHCLLQVFIASEETKYGLDDLELEALIQHLVKTPLPYIKIVGLMGMASNTDNVNQVKKEFHHLKTLFDNYQTIHSKCVDLKHLSMGMSGDYKIAIEEGSNMIRVGSTLFGER